MSNIWKVSETVENFENFKEHAIHRKTNKTSFGKITYET